MPDYDMPSTAISGANKEAKEVMASCNCLAAIATLIANGLYAFPFLCWQVSTSSRSGKHHPYIHGILNETS